MHYDHKSVESKWQQYWLKNKTFQAVCDDSKPSFYALDMFPFPSGAGLHVGHPVGYIATDILSRKRRMDGYSVLHPMGWDAFGLPAENYAIKTGVHPAVATRENINNFRKQIQSLGMSYDWDREIDTTHPDYYKWTQWLFLQFYKQGLLYQQERPMNWCPKCRVVCANEEVEQGTHERCGSLVESKNLRQWMFEITKYADRLLEDLDESTLHLFHGWGGSGKEGWFKTIAEFCKETKWPVTALDFPETENPTYEDWKAHFQKHIHRFGTQDVCIGHSLGATFLLRYLSEENVKIDHLILVAPACYECAEIPEIANFFQTSFDFEKIKASTNLITVLASDNDEFISEDSFELLATELDAYFIVLPERGHLSPGGEEDLPELLAIVEELGNQRLDWPEKIKAMQRNWVGKSQGVNFKNRVKGMDIEFEVYNSVPQTYYAETFTGVAPEHPMVYELVKGTDKEEVVMAFVERVKKKKIENKFNVETDLEGIFTGRYVENFAGTGHDLEIWVASYIVADYGTGIVNCSAHDERDFAFAKAHNIPLRPTMFPSDPVEAEKVRNCEYCYFKEPKAIMEICPDQFKGRLWGEVREDIIDYVVEQGYATRQINYKLRDWIFTRQRYWGEPIPLVFDEKGDCYPLEESQLPLILPQTPNYEPSESGESPLAKITDWVNVQGYITDEGDVVICEKAPAGKTLQKFRRETSTMPNWAGSNWYWLRFMDARNEQEFCSKEAEQYWGPVDLYVGGAEHAVLHLLYSRFWHKVLYDMGLVSTKEPFKKLLNQGLIMAEDGSKMSKSLGNVVNPDEIVEKYGADTLRCYEMFMGPFEHSKQWNTDALAGMRKFLDRIWKLFEKPLGDEQDFMQKPLHTMIKKVTEDIEGFRFNTGISQMMIFLNEASKWEQLPQEGMRAFVKILSPFAPHLAEEIWSQFLGGKTTLTYEAWPSYDAKYLVEDTVTYAVQVNGKLRADFQAAADAGKEEVIAAAKEIEKVQKYLSEGNVVKEIFVPGKIVGFVVK